MGFDHQTIQDRSTKIVRGENTRQRVLRAALELFAQQGFERVTMADIAAAVSIKAPSLYKHFASKQEIYDTILAECLDRFVAFSSGLGVPTDLSSPTGMDIAGFTPQALTAIGEQLFDFLLHDELTASARRMLIMRQFSEPRAAQLYVENYIQAPMGYQGAALAGLQAAGVLPTSDPQASPELLGLEFFSPIFLLIARCDACPAYEPEARRLLAAHIQHFLGG